MDIDKMWEVIGHGWVKFYRPDNSYGVYEPLTEVVNGHKWTKAESLNTWKSDTGIYLSEFSVDTFMDTLAGPKPVTRKFYEVYEVWSYMTQDHGMDGGDPVLLWSGDLLSTAFLEFHKEHLMTRLDNAMEAIREHEMDQMDF